MVFKTLEQMFLAQYATLEKENERLESEADELAKKLEQATRQAVESAERAKALEKRLQEQVKEIHSLRRRLNLGAGGDLEKTEIELDHAEDCIKDMLATAKWYGFDQPQNVGYDPTAGMVAR